MIEVTKPFDKKQFGKGFHGKPHGAARDRFLVSLGIRVSRFTGKQVEFETERVLSEID